MTDTNNIGNENKAAEKMVLGFCSKFQPQIVPHAVGPGKTLINYKPYYFPCTGDKCTDSWCHEHKMCRHACEHLEAFHPLEEGEDEESIMENDEEVLQVP